MDDELRNMLSKLMEGQEAIKIDINVMKTDISKINMAIEKYL